MFTVHVHTPLPDGSFGDSYRLRSVESVLFCYVDYSPDAANPRLCVCRVTTEQLYQLLVLEVKDQPLWYGAAAIFDEVAPDDLVIRCVRYRLGDPRSGWRVPAFADHAFFTPVARNALATFASLPVKDQDTLIYPAPPDEVSIYVQ